MNAGIDDVFHQDHIVALDAVVQIFSDAHDSGSAVLVREAGNRQEIDLQGKLYVARQRGQKVHRALEHADQLHRASGIGACDLGADFADAPVDFLFGEQDFFESPGGGGWLMPPPAFAPDRT